MLWYGNNVSIGTFYETFIAYERGVSTTQGLGEVMVLDETFLGAQCSET